MNPRIKRVTLDGIMDLLRPVVEGDQAMTVLIMVDGTEKADTLSKRWARVPGSISSCSQLRTGNGSRFFVASPTSRLRALTLDEVWLVDDASLTENTAYGILACMRWEPGT